MSDLTKMVETMDNFEKIFDNLDVSDKMMNDVFDLNMKLKTIQDFGGWDSVSAKHFANGGIFDEIYEK